MLHQTIVGARRGVVLNAGWSEREHPPQGLQVGLEVDLLGSDPDVSEVGRGVPLGPPQSRVAAHTRRPNELVSCAADPLTFGSGRTGFTHHRWSK